MTVANEWLKIVIDTVGAVCATAVGKLLLAALVFVVGRALIKWALRLMHRGEKMMKLDASVQSITSSVITISLYTLLLVTIVSILGVPMASITAVIAAAAAAIGLAMQGTLSSFAAGIEILLFRPFGIGDYIAAAGTEGKVKDINIFFTVLVTIDNKRVTVPNSAIMGGIVTNYTAEGTRRLELSFKAPAGTDSAKVLEILRSTAAAHPLALAEPEAPYSRINGAADGLVEYIVRVWCASADYWTVHFELINSISAALADAGVQPGIKRIVVENKQNA